MSLFRYCIAFIVFVAASVSAVAEPASQDGALSPALIDELRIGFRFDAETRVRHNAVTNASINDLSLNRAIVAGEDGHFSHRIKTKGVTNQKASGRCWMFAGLNTMRPKVIDAKKLDSFEFSTAYLQFWDKMEKANLFLEYMIEMRDTDYLDREWELVHKWTLGDGGWWNFVVDLIEKYGVVPKSVMPETKSSENTNEMNTVLERMLNTHAVKLHAMHKGGKSVAELREFKKKALAEVYRFLVINLGEPPQEFEWRYVAPGSDKEDESKEKIAKAGDKPQPAATIAVKPGDTSSLRQFEVRPADDVREAAVLPAASTAPATSAVKGLTPLRKYTPQEFYKEYVGVPLRDYVCLYNDPTNAYRKHLRFSRARNMAGSPDMDFVNLESDALKSIAAASVIANEPVWFAADVGKDQSSTLGLMADRLYDYGPLFGVDLAMTKADRIRYRAEASNHAMVFMGVDMRPTQPLAPGAAADAIPKATPVKWLVENSWGDAKGQKGTWTLYDGWFNEHVFVIIVNKKHVPADVLKIFDEPAKVLPAWYPGAMGVE